MRKGMTLSIRTILKIVLGILVVLAMYATFTLVVGSPGGDNSGTVVGNFLGSIEFPG
jgi:hypothetical protein